MNNIENSKLTRIVSTKITDEEFNFLMRLARQYQSQGYIVKANPSEIVRLILRMFRQYLLSHKNDQFKMGIKNTKQRESKYVFGPIIKRVLDAQH